MRTVRSIATVLYYLTRIMAVLFLFTGLYAVTVLWLSKNSASASLPISIKGDHFTIFYPLTNQPFLLGDYTASYIITSFATVLLYGMFLWLLSGVFHAFKLSRLFTGKSLQCLSRFYQFNFTVPIIGLLLFIIFRQETQDIMVITFLHVMIGVFAFFMAAMFKQGLILQEEQDLTF